MIAHGAAVAGGNVADGMNIPSGMEAGRNIGPLARRCPCSADLCHLQTANQEVSCVFALSCGSRVRADADGSIEFQSADGIERDHSRFLRDPGKSG